MIPVTESTVSVYTVPTDGPESDGTLEWTSTTIVVVEVFAGRVSGLGFWRERRFSRVLSPSPHC